MFSRPLWRWYSRPLTAYTFPAAVAAFIWACLAPGQPFHGTEFIPWLCCVLHVFITQLILGRLSNATGEFLCTRGYPLRMLSRVRLAVALWHTGLVWLSASLPLWTGIRSWVQAALLQNPEFPLLDGVDCFVPLTWLLTLGVLTCLMHYHSMRSCLPVRGRMAGAWLAAGWILVDAVARNGVGSPSLVWMAWTVPLLLAATALWASIKLSSNVEVQA